jgi:hypothetical protein
MSYGTCKRAQKKIVCIDCGEYAKISNMPTYGFDWISRGRQNRYRCLPCAINALHREQEAAQ